MKPEPLNLKDLRERIRDLTILYSTAREEGDEEEHKRVVNEILLFFKQKIKSACEFYLRYWREPGLLVEEHPEYKKDVLKLKRDAIFEVDGLIEDVEQIEGPFAALYIEWLFRQAFKDRLEGDK